MSKLLYSLVFSLTSCKATSSTRSVAASSRVSHAATAEPTFRHQSFTLRVPAGRRRRGPGFGSIPSAVRSLHQPTASRQAGQHKVTSRCVAWAGTGVTLCTEYLSTWEQRSWFHRQDSETNHHPHSFNLGVPIVLFLDHNFNCGSQGTAFNSGTGEQVQVRQTFHDSQLHAVLGDSGSHHVVSQGI